MKTHIPTKLRKALIAALFAVSAVAYNAQAEYNDDFNVGSDARNSVTDTYLEADALGYVDFTFRGLDPVLGTAHFTHSFIPVDYYTRLVATVGSSGKYEFHTLKADQGCDPEYDIHTGQYIGEGAGYYSTSWSNGNITMTDEAVMEVTASISANGAININGASRVTAGNKVTAGEIQLTGSSLTTGNISVSQNDLWVPGEDSIKSSGALSISGSNANVTATGTVSAVGAVNVSQGAYLNADKVAAGEINVNDSSLTAGNITVTKNSLWVADGDPIESSGELRLSGSNANVTATGIVSAAGGVAVSQGAHLNASKITSKVTGNAGYVRALPNQNLTVTGVVASEKTQYIVDNGYTISLGGIGELVNEGTEDDPVMVMHGNGNSFGYGEDSNNIKADAIYVMGDIISDKNELAVLGNAVYDHMEDPDSSAIYVKGSITGNGNELLVRNQDAAGIWVAKDISGDNNSLVTNGDGDIHIAGTLGRGKDSEKGIALGNSITAGDDITIHQYSDNENLTIDAMNGELTVEEASEATLINADICAEDQITIYSNGEDAKSSKVLNLVGGSVVSEMGDIIANQVISANGTALTAEAGDINVYSLVFDPENVNNTGIQVTTNNLIAEQDLKLNGKKTGSFDSFVTVAEDMRTTKGSISITNFTDKDKVNVGHDIESADSITVNNVNGMLVGTEDEDGFDYEGSMTAKTDIAITDSVVKILGNQKATDGKITITTTPESQTPSVVSVDGNQTAGTTISAQGATLRVGVLVEDADTGTYSVEGGKQVAGGDISVINSLMEVLDSMESTGGQIQIQGSTVTVGAKDEDGNVVQAGDMTAKNDISIKDSDVTVLGNQISKEQSIVISDLDPAKNPTKVTVNGDQTAKGSISATKAELTVGTIETIEDELTGEITYELHGGNQTAETGDISLSNAKVAILGHQDATEGNISITDGTTLKVGAVAEDGEIVQESNQTAAQNITISDSDVTVLGDQTSTEGSIAITDLDSTKNPTKVAVNGDQTAKGSISATKAELTVGIIEEIEDEETGEITYELHGGNQTAVEGDIAITNSTADILGHQEATAGSISVTGGSTLMVGAVAEDGEIVQASNQTAEKNITITDSDVKVLGDQTATTGSIIVAKDSTLTVGAKDEDGNVISQGDQWAAQNIKIVAGSAVEVIGDQTARDEDIIVKGSTLTVGAIQENAPLFPGWPSTYELIGGNQTAGGNIVLVNDKNVDVLGDQDAGASIIVKKTTLTVGAKADDGKVVHAGDQTAVGNIVIVKDSDVAILGNEMAGGDIVVKDSTLKVGELEHISIMPWPAFDWLHGGDQTANGNIFISNADVDVLRNQQAVTGAISIQKGSDVTIGSEDSAGHVLGGDQTAQTNINIANSTVHVLGDEKAVTGEIVIAKTDLEGADTIVNVDGDQEAGDYINVTNSQLTVGTAELVTDETTGEQHVVLTGGNQTAQTDINISNSTVEVLGDQTATKGGIKIDKLSLVTIGTVDVDGTVLAGDQLAKRDIEIDSSTLMVMDNQTSQEGSISVQALDDFSLVMVGGSQTAKKHIGIFGSKEHEKPTTVLVGEDQIAGEGNIAINDAQVAVKGKVVALGDGTDGTGIVTLAGATYDVGVSLQAKELNIGTIDNPSTVTINVDSLDADGNPLDTVLDVDKLTVAEGNTLHTGNVKMDATDVSIAGAVEVGVKDEDPEKAIAANWDTEGSHLISGEGASLKANGNIRIASAAEGDTTVINNGATVAATGNVTIQGLAAALAVVDNANVRANGDITLDRAELTKNHDTGIITKGGNIVLKNRVEISDTILNVQAPEGAEPGVINVAEGADVQLYQGTVDVFNGALAGTGTVTANDENLVISHDSRGFNGTINMVRDNEQTLYIASKGVGDKAVLSMQNGSSLGTIVGGQDANLGNVVTTDGSHIQMNAVDKGNRTTATSLNLTAGTTYELFATTDDTTGALLADTITVSNGINANGARVRAHSDTPLEALADGSRFTIAGGTVVSGFNEDVLYDMVKPDAGSKRTARALQTRNMHLEHTAHGVDLVVSENYKGIDDRNANANAVREVILPLDVAADHRPGVLAGSASELDHVLDALDYTRSGADAREGLLSLSGAANLIVPNMMMDASRHHLSALRDHMSVPVCTDNRKTKGNVWAAYTGGYDHIGGDENMHAYSHSYQGALVGGDYAVNCNWAVGLSLGYQKSIARTEGTRADADAISGDLYAVGRTGKYTHRFSMGLTSYSTDVKRGTRIAAAGHTYHGQSTGSADGMSWNFGYQLSRNFAINQVSTITPYLTVDVALQRIDTLNEKGQGDASVVTDYEDFVQTDAALGVAYSHTFTSFNRQAGVFSVNLAAHGEFSEHRATAKNHFAGYADTWKTRSMKRAPFYGELGADVVVPFGEHISGTAGVNFEFSADRTFVGGHAGVNYRF